MARKKGAVVCRSTEAKELAATLSAHYALAERISKSLRASWKTGSCGALEDVVRIYANSAGLAVRSKTAGAINECSRILNIGTFRCDCPDCGQTHYGPGTGFIDGVTVEVTRA